MKIVITEEQKNKLFIPRRIDERQHDLIKSMITTNYDIGEYLKRREIYKDFHKEIDPEILKLNKEDLIKFIKANPFWLNSIGKVDFLFQKLTYDENKDIAENHIGNELSGGKHKFYTTSELKYFESRFDKPKDWFDSKDVYVFVGSYEFKESSDGKYEKYFDIENLFKISSDSWDDTSDFQANHIVRMMKIRANTNNKILYTITANKGLLEPYRGKSSDEIPPYILSAIDEKKQKI